MIQEIKLITETFIPGRGVIYRLDPRPKFLLLVSLVMIFLVEPSLPVLAGITVLILLLIGASLGLPKVVVPLKSILPILILTALLTPPFNTGGAAVLRIGEKVLISGQGLLLTGRLLLRFTGITAVFFLFFSTTPTGSFVLALQDFGLPYKAALTVTISLRYIPDMFNTYHRISDAHKLRSADASTDRPSAETSAADAKERDIRRKKRKSFRYRLRKLFPVLISVLINAVKSIPALAMALDSKGFGRDNPRSSCRKLPPWPEISMQLVLSLAALAGFIAAAVIW